MHQEHRKRFITLIMSISGGKKKSGSKRSKNGLREQVGAIGFSFVSVGDGAGGWFELPTSIKEENAQTFLYFPLGAEQAGNREW